MKLLAVKEGAVEVEMTEMAESKRKARMEEIAEVPRLLKVTLAVLLLL